MRRLLPTFGLRTLLLLVAVAACLAATGERTRRKHFAAKCIEAHGGDVWVGGALYSGNGLGLAPRTELQIIFERTKIYCNLLRGQESRVWVCFMPEDRDAFADAIALLNAKAITFDVLGEADRSWLLSQFANLDVSSVCMPTSPADQSLTVPKNAQAAMEPVDRRENFILALELVEQFFTENPERAYRLQRYEPLIGYPAYGEMGRTLDHETGRIIYLPWPRDSNLR